MIRSVLALLLGAFVLGTTSLLAQDKRIEFVEYEMDNGLHVILHQDNSTPNVVVSVLYHVGSKNEEPNRTGMAHFFEHLLFEGSANLGRGEIDALIQEAGGANNANTSQDRTFYYELLPSNHLGLGLYIESERMLHAKIDSTGIAVQREVVKEEKRQRIDNQPYMSFQQEMMSRAFPDMNYRWTPIGSMEDLNAAQFDDFMEFYRTFYVPNNATLSIAGDIDIEETKKMVEQYFAEIPRGTREIPRPKPSSKLLETEKRDTVYDNIQLPGYFCGYRMPAEGTDDYYALNMLSNVLSAGQSSRINKRAVDEEQIAAQVINFPSAFEDAGIYIMVGIANAGKSLEELEALFDDEIKKVQTDMISDYEFQKVRNQIESGFYGGNSSIADIAESLANYHVYYGDANLINTELQRYMSVTREDIRRVARKYLVPTNRVVLYYLPKSAQAEN